jgi:PAS domain S-box-containing protein
MCIIEAGGTVMALKDSSNNSDHLRAIINSIEDELLVIGYQYRIIEVNEAVLLKHRKPREEVIGQYCYTISHGLTEPCHQQGHRCPIEEVLRTNKPAKATHIHLYNIDSQMQERYVDIIASPLYNGRGNIYAVTEVIRDVTDVKELELKISKAQQNLSALNIIANAVIQSLDLDTILASALDKTLEIFNSNLGGILILDEGANNLYYKVHHGLSTEYISKMSLSLGEGIAGKVAQTGEPMLSEDISSDPRAARPKLINREGLRAFASVPLRSKDKILGVINIASYEARRFSLDDVQLLESVAAQMATAVENATLHQEALRKEQIKGELLQDILTIQEEERKRIARELHDETSQMLAGLTANLEAAVNALHNSVPKAEPLLRKAQSLSINIMDEIHRVIYELRPSLLDDLGLVAAVRWLADNKLGNSGVNLQYKVIGNEKRLPHQLETTIFRVIQEALNNVARHAHAKNVIIILSFSIEAIEVRIADDGTGFNVPEAISSKERPRGLGLLGMKERVELIPLGEEP